MSSKRVLIAGMPSSGKSTFIAAMRHVLLSNETETALVSSRLADDERHLNALQDKWLALETFERTREKSEAWVTLHVRDTLGGTEAELIIPDLRGEMFERPAAFGTCSRAVSEALGDADGVLLFTNAEKPDDALLISDYGDADDDEEGGLKPAGSTGEARIEVSDLPVVTEPEIPPVEGAGEEGASKTGRLRFQADRMPEEAKIVELLQFANRRPRPRRRRRLAIMVSAWDAVIDGGDDRTPAQWMALQRPMLSQFLQHNADAWEVRIYGVSAQGGKLPRDKARLQALETGSERIIMVGHGVPRHDPTAPVAWLISGG